MNKISARKIVFVLVSAFFVVGATFGYFKYNRVMENSISGSLATRNPIASSTNGTPSKNPDIPIPQTPSVTSLIKDKAWEVLAKYLEAAKNHDLESVKNLSYQLSDSCKDPKMKKECESKMDTVYYFGNELEKDEFKNVWNDSKQIILTTNLRREENDEALSLSKGIIYFVIDSENNIKLLKFNDSKGIAIPKEGRSIEEANFFLNKMMADADKDGIEDEIEKCGGQDEKSCQKTNPEKRDTDGDGFWDGTETQFF